MQPTQTAEVIDLLKEHFPPIATAGLWYNYVTSGNATGSFVILSKSEYVRVKNVSFVNDTFLISFEVRTNKYENGTLVDSGSVEINVRLHVHELPEILRVLWFFFNAKNVKNSVLDYIKGLAWLLENVTTLEVQEANYTFMNMTRTVVIGLLEGTKANGTEFIHAKYVVDVKTGLLLEKEYYRYVRHSPPELAEAMKTVLKDTNFFKKPVLETETEQAPETELKLVFSLPTWLVILIAIAIAVPAAVLILKRTK